MDFKLKYKKYKNGYHYVKVDVAKDIYQKENT